MLQKVMNKALVDNAILGPWIHVGSRMQLLSAARTGDEITARAKVTANYDKKGHRFVELDALVVANGNDAAGALLAHRDLPAARACRGVGPMSAVRRARPVVCTPIRGPEREMGHVQISLFAKTP